MELTRRKSWVAAMSHDKLHFEFSTIPSSHAVEHLSFQLLRRDAHEPLFQKSLLNFLADQTRLVATSATIFLMPFQNLHRYMVWW